MQKLKKSLLMFLKVVFVSMALSACAILPETNPLGVKEGVSMRTGETVRGDEAYIDYREYNRRCFYDNGDIKPECLDENGNAIYPSR